LLLFQGSSAGFTAEGNRLVFEPVAALCRAMPHDPHAKFDHSVLEMIEHSPVGAVPRTPTHQDALERLQASHQIYPDADHANGFVTVRSLATRPCIHAGNLEAWGTGAIEAAALESNASIFDRYVAALPVALRARAESHRLLVAGRPAHHRKHGGEVAHDPVHTLFLVPGAGAHPGIPGNYLHGSLLQLGSDPAKGGWAVHLHDRDDGAAMCDLQTLPDALAKLQEVIASAPFHLNELGALGFRPN
jgi:hypothetical protein